MRPPRIVRTGASLVTFTMRGNAMRKLINKLRRNEDGVTALEYGLIAALIAVVIIGAVGTLGKNVSSTFNTVANAISP